jgi:hypothetical protein
VSKKKEIKAVKEIPLSQNVVLSKCISGFSTDADGNLHIVFDDEYEIVCHDVIGDNVEYGVDLRTVYSEMKLSNKIGWILKDIKLDYDKNDLAVYISPKSLENLEESSVFYKFRLIEQPFRKLDKTIIT